MPFRDKAHVLLEIHDRAIETSHNVEVDTLELGERYLLDVRSKSKRFSISPRSVLNTPKRSTVLLVMTNTAL